MPHPTQPNHHPDHPSPSTTLYLAGGGSGGHIYPNIAIAKQIQEQAPNINIHFLIANKDIDKQILQQTPYPFTPLPVQPLTKHPKKIIPFYNAWAASIKICKALFKQSRHNIILTTGGFVAGPAVAAAYKLRKKNNHRILVNLDAVPGIANQSQYKKATQTYSVYPLKTWPKAQLITLPQQPLPANPPTPQASRQSLNLDPHRQTLLITGGSQGALSINHAITALFQKKQIQQAFQNWQILHITGPTTYTQTQAQYQNIPTPHQVLPYCQNMPAAWLASDLAITRAGAGTVAQAIQYQTPTIFLPYPFHRDQHQRLNALPLAQKDAAILLEDSKSPQQNAATLLPILLKLAQSPARLSQMRSALASPTAPDGLSTICAHIQSQLTT